MSELTKAIAQFRRLRAQREQSTVRQLQAAYARAVASLEAQLEQMTAWLDANPDPPLWRLLAEARTRNLLFQAEAAFNRYSREVGDTIVREQRQAVAQAMIEAETLIREGFGTPPPFSLGMPFVRLPESAVNQLVATLQPGAPVRNLLDEFGGNAAKAVEGELIAGVAIGRNPRATARAIRDVLGGQETRALLITRTETLRAYRGAQLEVYRENRHLVKGWRWHSALDGRTCPVCIALHGRLFATDEPMRPHPACRCSVIPETKSWRDLGFDVPEPDRAVESGVEWFGRQDVSLQREILGPQAYDAYAAGDVELEDFIRLRRSRTWGSSYVRGSLDRAKANAANRTRRAA